MEDKNKTNEELLEETKKLRISTEKENATKDGIRKWESWGLVIGIIILTIFFLWRCSI